MVLVDTKPDFTKFRAEHARGRRERARKRLVMLIFLVYWLLILEGILRKWILPEYSKELFFIRDPFVLLIYFIAWRNGMWPKLQGLFLAAVILGLLVGVLVIAQLLATHHTTVLLAAYGWRAYFLYIPLAFIIGKQFKHDDITRLMRHTMILSLPIAVLVAVQFYSSPTSWINVQAFDGIMGRIRPAGTFSSVVGQWMFGASLVAFLITTWVSRVKERKIGRTLLYLATAAAFVCLGVSISRGMIIQSAIVMLSAIFAGLIMRGGASTMRAWVFPLTLSIVGIALFPILLPEAYEVNAARWGTAQHIESHNFQLGLLGRALYNFFLFVSYIPSTPIIGWGMGLGGNAGQLDKDIKLPILAEDDWSRQIVDIGPIFGVLYIVLRVSFFIILGLRSVGATRRSGQALPVVLFGFVGITLLFGQITGQGSANGYAWIFVGLLMASINLSSPKIDKRTPVTTPKKVGRANHPHDK